jgi:hypothetical protein
MKKISVIAIAAIVTMVAASSYAFIREDRPRFTPPSTYPAEIQGLRYLDGLIRMDPNKYGVTSQPKIWAKFTKKDFSIERQRIDQSTLNDKARKLEFVEIKRIPYKKIIDVWYGDEALRNLAVMSFPTKPQSGRHGPREVFLDQRYYAPVVVVYKKNRKEKATLVVMGPNDKSWATYTLLMRQKIRHAKK